MTLTRQNTPRATTPAPPTRKGQAKRGWCPGALRPMQSGDGLIVRVRPRLATLQLDAMRAIALAARDFGNGIIDLTRRANVQVRGLAKEPLADMHAVLRAHNLLDENADAESVRNILVPPLANLRPDDLCDVHAISKALWSRLGSDERLWRLPGKFGFLLDTSANSDLSTERADIHLTAYRDTSGNLAFKIGLDRPKAIEWLGTTQSHDPEKLVDILVAIALAAIEHAPEDAGQTQRIRDLPNDSIHAIRNTAARHLSPISEDHVSKYGGSGVAPEQGLGQQPHSRKRLNTELIKRPLGLIELDPETAVLALAAPFGSLEASSWLKLLDAAQEVGVKELRLSPWRTIYLPLPKKECATNLIDAAQRAGFIADPTDPILRIDACPGAPNCESAYSDTRRAARTLANQLTTGERTQTIHVSGCTKGCARSQPADLVLVAGPDGYGVIRNATASDKPETTIPYDQLGQRAGSLARST